MDSPQNEVPLSQALADYRLILAKIEPILSEWWTAVSRYSPKDPLRRLLALYIKRWRKFRKWVNRNADEDYAGLFREITELGSWLPGMATTRPPFPLSRNEEMGQVHQAAGFSEQEVGSIMTVANKRPMGAPRNRREIAMKAFRMWNAGKGKSYRQIADALCDCGNHRRRRPLNEDKRLSPCADRYRGEIRELKAVLNKYSR